MEVVLQKVKAYGVVTYYTVKIEGRVCSEFTSFLEIASESEKCNDHFKKLLRQIENIGNRGYKLEWNFKNEDAAFRFWLDGKSENSMAPDCMWRLYCLPLHPNIVIIFGGCRKTEQKARKCRNCRRLFDESNKLAQQISKAWVEKDLWCIITARGVELDFNEFFTIEL